MSVSRFVRRLKLIDVRDSERTWFPRWLDGYVRFHRLDPDRQLKVSEPMVVAFLRSLRDNSYPAWKRCQAARAIELYQKMIIGQQRVDFGPIRRKLDELARREQVEGELSGTGSANQTGSPSDGPPQRTAPLVAGEGNRGRINASDPEPVRQMRERMRVLHHPKSTEDAYVGWVQRLIKFTGSEELKKFGEAEIAAFLTELAVEGDVVAGTQNQALAAFKFLYEKTYGQQLGFVNSMQAKESQ